MNLNYVNHFSQIQVRWQK